MTKRLIQKEKNRWRWARRYELNMNKEFCVENSRSISNNIGFACISQSRNNQSTKFEFGSHQYGKIFSRVLNENTESSSQIWHSDVNQNSNTSETVTETTENVMDTKLIHHNLQISKYNVGHFEKLHLNVKWKLERQSRDDMSKMNVHAMIQRIFSNTYMDDSVHLGQDE